MRGASELEPPVPGGAAVQPVRPPLIWSARPYSSKRRAVKLWVSAFEHSRIRLDADMAGEKIDPIEEIAIDTARDFVRRYGETWESRTSKASSPSLPRMSFMSLIRTKSSRGPAPCGFTLKRRRRTRASSPGFAWESRSSMVQG